jgi:predicted small lipoprotein YifL
MKSFSSLVTVVLVLSFTMMFAACDKKGPAEKAGEKVDQAVEKTMDAVKDATNEVAEDLKQ